MKKKQLLALMTGTALSLSLVTVPTLAAEKAAPAASFVNTGGEGENYISLCEGRSFKAVLPVDLTEEEAKAAETVIWSLDYDADAGYLDPALFPNHTQGGALDTWKAMNGEDLFTTPVTKVETVDGQVCLTAEFDSSIYFYGTNRRTGAQYADPSAPHTEGGAYMDLCGWYDLTATAGGEKLGAVENVKITPYDNFHTMKEVYATLDELVAFAKENTDLYVEKFSMGKTQGDNGHQSLDMPYLIIAKSKAAVDNWQKLKAQAESDPASVIEKLESGALKDYQVPILYSNVHTNEVSATDGILKFAALLLETAAGNGKIDYKNLTGFTAAGEAELAKQMGPAGEEGSVAVPDLVKDTATYLGYIKPEGSSASGVVDLDKFYTSETVTVDTDALLDDVFFLIVPAENAEGRTYLTRESSGGVDLNRDNSFQTQAETQNMTHLIASWNPVSFTEFHGRVSAFQCEPCDPPHEPNFEYDLLSEHLVSGGEAFGIAAVANNDSYNSYVIPQRDYLSYNGQKTADGKDQTQWFDPWDDMSTSYTPQYSMLHGTVAYTVEQPAYNDQTATAIAYGQLGQSHYIAENKAGYLLAQAKIFERGVTNANSDAYDLVGQWFCDQYDVEGAEMDVFRPEYDGEGQNGNFYPECYIIPLDSANQKNLDAADQMLTYLKRNGVKVLFADQAFTYNGTEYPAGTAVVSMYQAKRSVANGVLYDGTVITGWPVLYSEGITAFNKTRGFDMTVCAEPESYKTIAAVCTEKDAWTVTSDKVDSDQVILCNTSEDAIISVNELLGAGKKVSVITAGDYAGSFLVSKADYESVSKDHLLTAAAVEGLAPAAKALTKAPVIYIAGKTPDNEQGFVHSSLINWNNTSYNYDRQSMELMGFQTTENVSEADLILGAVSLDDAALAAVKAGTAYIGYGPEAMDGAMKLFGEGELVWQAAADQALDALAYVTYPTKSPITASYVAEGDDILYGYGAGYFAAIPEGAQVLVKLDGSKELLEGFLPKTGEHYEDFLNDSIQAISYKKDGMDVVLFANTLTNKMHQRDEFGFIANAAFTAVAQSFKDVPENAWYAATVDQAVTAGIMVGTGNGQFRPEADITLATVCQALYNMEGKPEGKPEVTAGAYPADAWYTDAVNWASQAGLVTVDGNFAPNGAIDRAATAQIVAAYCQGKGLTAQATGKIDQVPDKGDIPGEALGAVTFCYDAGILIGDETGAMKPGDILTRAQLATILLRVAAL